MNDSTTTAATSTAPAQQRMGVVGIGASAGGLRPLQALFAAMPDDSGMAFIVVQHLSPDFDSVMDTLLAKHTNMPIYVIENGMEVVPNTIYLNPPKFKAEVFDGKFLLSEFAPSGLRLPINSMFQTIAEEYGSASVAVVLSGTGSDGTKGLVSVHNAGGTTIVQSLDSVEFDGMPRSALATDMVDHTCSPAAIADLIRKHARNDMVRSEVETPLEQPIISEYNNASSIRLIFSLLSTKHGIDFAHYKPTTVARRIDRRLQLSRHGSLDAYAKVLNEQPAELDLLYHDLLIGVTYFFRDSQAFELLASHLVARIAELPDGEELRVWSAGCASGEEAYSLAILLTTLFDQANRPALFKVFATDVHDRSLDCASRGIYRTELIQGLTPAQLKLFFSPHGQDSMKVVPSLRHHIVFARQNVVSDAPFTRIDLLLCRNLLIYLQEAAQATAIAGFHFALKEDGVMMLGPSETVGALGVGFHVINKHWRFFRKNSTPAANLLLRQAAAKNQKQSVESSTLQLVEAEGHTVRMSATSYQLLSQYLGDAVLLDPQKRIQQVFGDPTFFLTNTDLRAGVHVADCLPLRSRPAIESLVVNAKKSPGAEFRINDLTSIVDGIPRKSDVIAKGFAGASVEAEIILLQFVAQRTKTQGDSLGSYQNLTESTRGHGAELANTKESLNSTIEELRAANEELHSANEEMIASNEELQSTNEELQSVNEELQTVNQEHQKKVLELEEMTDDFNNFFNSTAVGSILLDKNLCIRKFTHSSSKYFRLMEHDVGRPLANFATQIVIEDLTKTIQSVLASGEAFSTYAQDIQGKWLSIDISPYFASNKVDGVIINLLNLTTLIDTTADCTGEMIIRKQSNLWQWTQATDEVWLSPELRILLLELADENEASNLIRNQRTPITWDQFRSLFVCHENMQLTPTLLQTRTEKRLLRITQNSHDSSPRPLDFRWISHVDSQGALRAITGSIEYGSNHG